MTAVDSLSPISIANDPHRISMSAAAERLGKSRQSPFRWAVKGVLLPNGSRVKLAACRIGSRWYTSEAAIAAFVEATSATPGNGTSTPAPTPAQRRRAAAGASAELDRLGIRD